MMVSGVVDDEGGDTQQLASEEFFESRVASFERELLDLSSEFGATSVASAEYDVSERAFDRAKALRRELRDIIAESEAVYAGSSSSKAAERETVARQIRESQATIAVLEAVVVADEELSQIESHVDSAELGPAAERLQALRLPDDSDSEVVGLLRGRAAACATAIETRLLEWTSALVQSDTGQLAVQSELSGLVCGHLFTAGEPLKIADLLRAARLLNGEEKLGDALAEVLEPFLQKALSQGVEQRPHKLSLLPPQETTEDEVSKLSRIFKGATAVLNFLLDELEGAEGLLRPTLALLLAPLHASLKALSLKLLPGSGLLLYEACSGLEQEAQNCDAAITRMAPAEANFALLLSQAATLGAAERSRVALTQAKDLILGDWHNSSQIPDRDVCDDLLSKEHCEKTMEVSELAQAVARKQREILAEAAAEVTPAECALGLYRTVRHIFELFRALLPLHHAGTMRSVPRMAQLFANDCRYLGRQALLFSHEFCPLIAAKQPESALLLSFVDQLVPLRNAAARPLDDDEEH